jgi:hypothetical protein
MLLAAEKVRDNEATDLTAGVADIEDYKDQ